MRKTNLSRIGCISILFLLYGCGGASNNASSDNAEEEEVVIAGSATLSWVAPTSRADNTPLAANELGGYKVYSGPSPQALTLLSDITDTSITEYVADGLSPATYYFAVTAYDSNGEESGLTPILSKTID